ncbi:MAG: hypothetical protein A2081_04610 [Elusimicrobia bacterium GWC2_61_19]|nr:MAG: hypothetical protein A2081_04610 [Elusimicrobia bacterium GWC2_61_19]
MRQRPARKLVRLVLLLRAAWLVPVTLMALAYAVYSVFTLGHLMRYPAASALLEIFEAFFGVGLGAAFLFFVGRMWRKTWDLLLDRIYPEPSAVVWQAGWIALAVVLPFMVIWPKVKDLLRYAGEGANKGALAQLRLAAEEYKNARGFYPANLADLEAAGLVRKLPVLWDKRGAGFPHGPASGVSDGAEARDTGGWAYSAAGGGTPVIFIDCTHKDSRGNPWSSY